MYRTWYIHSFMKGHNVGKETCAQAEKELLKRGYRLSARRIRKLALDKRIDAHETEDVHGKYWLVDIDSLLTYISGPKNQGWPKGKRRNRLLDFRETVNHPAFRKEDEVWSVYEIDSEDRERFIGIVCKPHLDINEKWYGYDPGEGGSIDIDNPVVLCEPTREYAAKELQRYKKKQKEPS
jgi:hypothetical protein